MAASDGIKLSCFKKNTLHSVKVSSSPSSSLLVLESFFNKVPDLGLQL